MGGIGGGEVDGVRPASVLVINSSMAEYIPALGGAAFLSCGLVGKGGVSSSESDKSAFWLFFGLTRVDLVVEGASSHGRVLGIAVGF